MTSRPNVSPTAPTPPSAGCASRSDWPTTQTTFAGRLTSWRRLGSDSEVHSRGQIHARMAQIRFRFAPDKLVQALVFFAHGGIRDLDKMKAAEMLFKADECRY